MHSYFDDRHHARIPPIEPGARRPLWSVLIPTHNCADYLREALGSVLRQDPGPERMEIIVVDDCSTEDDPGAVVREVGGERVRFIRQERNVGKVRNYETGLRESRGRLIHQLHGDDRVREGFYRAMENLFEEVPGLGAAFCRSVYIDENGKWTALTGMEQYADGVVEGFLERIVIGQRVQTPAMVVRREVYEQLGGFDRRFDCMEDWEMWIRIAAHYPVGFLNRVLAQYRVHGQNATHETLLSGEALATQDQLLRIVDEYLPGELVRKVRRPRAGKQAEFLLEAAGKMRQAGSGELFWRCVGKALRLSLNPCILWRAVRLLIEQR